MRLHLFRVVACAGIAATVGFAESLVYDFNNFKEGPIEGQHEWNVYDMVKDSSGLSVMDGVGTRGVPGDKALVLQQSDESIRCVTGEPLRWLPGRTLKAEFDFRLGAAAGNPRLNAPVMTFMVGNPLLSEKARWQVGIEMRPDGDWQFTGAMPDKADARVYGENLLIRSDSGVSLSEWFRFKLVVKKLAEPDAFETRAEISDTQGKVVKTLKFGSETKDKITKAMWSLPRVHVGFRVNRSQQGIAVIDNLSLTATD